MKDYYKHLTDELMKEFECLIGSDVETPIFDVIYTSIHKNTITVLFTSRIDIKNIKKMEAKFLMIYIRIKRSIV